jgi:hypothetical protein
MFGEKAPGPVQPGKMLPVRTSLDVIHAGMHAQLIEILNFLGLSTHVRWDAVVSVFGHLSIPNRLTAVMGRLTGTRIPYTAVKVLLG